MQKINEEPAQTLRAAADLLTERQKIYGDPNINFQRIAKVASVLLNKPVTRYDVAAILFAVKVGRIPEDPAYGDSYDDGINYLAIMKMFREEAKWLGSE